MRFVVALGVAFYTAKIVFAADLPQVSQMVPDEGKGTIGLVCIDETGAYHFWNQNNQDEFKSCLDHVVLSWGLKNASSAPDDMIHGMAAYRESAARVSASSAECSRGR